MYPKVTFSDPLPLRVQDQQLRSHDNSQHAEKHKCNPCSFYPCEYVQISLSQPCSQSNFSHNHKAQSWLKLLQLKKQKMQFIECKRVNNSCGQLPVREKVKVIVFKLYMCNFNQSSAWAVVFKMKNPVETKMANPCAKSPKYSNYPPQCIRNIWMAPSACMHVSLWRNIKILLQTKQPYSVILL